MYNDYRSLIPALEKPQPRPRSRLPPPEPIDPRGVCNGETSPEYGTGHVADSWTTRDVGWTTRDVGKVGRNFVHAVHFLP